jgi:hypothetical protein
MTSWRFLDEKETYRKWYLLEVLASRHNQALQAGITPRSKYNKLPMG